MSLVYSPPDFPILGDRVGVFLGGSIEMGAAIDWQDDFIKHFETSFEEVMYQKHNGFTHYLKKDRYVLLNPRRPEWDSSWEQSIKNPQFYQQVSWELSYLEQAKHRVFYFAADTMSPITLLEFGSFHNYPGFNYICWNDNYKRAGNLEIFCQRYNIKRYGSFDDIIKTIKKNDTL